MQVEYRAGSIRCAVVLTCAGSIRCFSTISNIAVVVALDRGGGWPQPQRDLLEFPAAAEIGGGGFPPTAVGIAVVETAILGSEELAGVATNFCSASSAAISPDSAPRHWWNLTVGVPHAAKVPADWLPARPKARGHGFGIEAGAGGRPRRQTRMARTRRDRASPARGKAG